MTGNHGDTASYAVELWRVSKHYPGAPPVEALTDVSISVVCGEFLGIVGASGSGKSTLLHVIGTLTKPTSGSVFIDGLDTAGLSDRELSGIRSRYVGFVFQEFFLLSGDTATENVANGLLYSSVPARERADRAKTMLGRVGLSHRLTHLPNELSGGEQQRVAIARALVHDPSFVLADEPTGNLDSRNTESLMELLASLNADGTTVILITHDLGVAEMCTRRVTLVDGRVEADTGAQSGVAHD
ncbi:MAG: ABC transporter ATP-binding protein [Chloroflexi bacterium]|nr:ABC transporter ATP-binding protein [Chloroflexota bacterium]|tara:strand:- start:3811 stop:4536 length:726 start_codon:yes stop_codon:yes gene_type:complete